MQRKVHITSTNKFDLFGQDVQEFLDSMNDKKIVKIYSTEVVGERYYFFCVYED
jgi:hypothetical protein